MTTTIFVPYVHKPEVSQDSYMFSIEAILAACQHTSNCEIISFYFTKRVHDIDCLRYVFVDPLMKVYEEVKNRFATVKFSEFQVNIQKVRDFEFILNIHNNKFNRWTMFDIPMYSKIGLIRKARKIGHLFGKKVGLAEVKRIVDNSIDNAVKIKPGDVYGVHTTTHMITTSVDVPFGHPVHFGRTITSDDLEDLVVENESEEIDIELKNKLSNLLDYF